MMAMAPANIVCTSPPVWVRPEQRRTGTGAQTQTKDGGGGKRKEDKHMMEGRETDWGWFLSPIVS